MNRIAAGDRLSGGDATNLDSDLEQIKSWGPKFSKISNIYGIKPENAEADDDALRFAACNALKVTPKSGITK